MQGLWRERERMRGNGMKEMNKTIMLIIIFCQSYCTTNFSLAFFDINLYKINLNVIQVVLKENKNEARSQSLEVNFLAFEGYYDRLTNRPTDGHEGSYTSNSMSNLLVFFSDHPV